MSQIDELKQLAIEADQRGDRVTATAAMDKIEALMAQPNVPRETPEMGVYPDVPAAEGPAFPEIQKPEREYTLEETLKGLGETALTLGTGATAGTAGMMYGTVKGILDAIRSGKIGTQEGVDLIQKAAMEQAGQYTYAPRTEAGQEYTREFGEIMEPMQAVAPLTGELGIMGQATRAAAPALRGIGQKAGQAAQTARETVAAGKEAGIPILTSDVLPPKTFIGKTGQAITERIPVVGTGPVRAGQYQKRVSAIRNVLHDYGAPEAATVTDDIMADLAKRRGTQISKYTDMKNSVIDRLSSRGTVNMGKTANIIDDEINKLKALKTQDVQPAINILEDYKTAFSDQNLQNIELLRKQLGERFKAPELAGIKSTADKAVNKIYGAVREDMGAFIKQSGEKGDYNKWQMGNKRLANMMGELKNTTLKSVLSKGEATPEQVRRLLFSQKRSDIAALRKNLSPEGRNQAKVAILQEVVDKVGGLENLTPEKFVNKLSKFDNQINAFFTDKDKRVVSGLIKALKATKQASVSSAKPPTGAELTAFAAPTGLAWMLGTDPVTGIAATGAIGLLARAYESRPIRNILITINATKAKSGSAINTLVQKLTALPEYKAYIAAQAGQEKE